VGEVNRFDDKLGNAGTNLANLCSYASDVYDVMVTMDGMDPDQWKKKYPGYFNKCYVEFAQE